MNMDETRGFLKIILKGGLYLCIIIFSFMFGDSISTGNIAYAVGSLLGVMVGLLSYIAGMVIFD